MLEVPQRRLFGTRDEFVSVFNAAMAELQHAYDAESIRNTVPSWAETGAPWAVFHVDLPTEIAATARGEHFLLRSLLLGLKDKNAQLLRVARVEKDGMTTLWAECGNGGRTSGSH
jgi:hypothetical protein